MVQRYSLDKKKKNKKTSLVEAFVHGGAGCRATGLLVKVCHLEPTAFLQKGRSFKDTRRKGGSLSSPGVRLLSS